MTRDTEPLTQIDFGYETNATLIGPSFDPNNSITFFNGQEMQRLDGPDTLRNSTSNSPEKVPLPNMFNLAEVLANQEKQSEFQQMLESQYFDQLHLRDPVYPNCDLQSLIQDPNLQPIVPLSFEAK